MQPTDFQLDRITYHPFKMNKFAAIALLVLAFAAVAFARQDEALDSMAMDELQPVSDPVPRLLAEALGTPSTVGAYGRPTTEPTTIPTTTVPAQTAGAAAASAGMLGMFAAALLAMAMF